MSKLEKTINSLMKGMVHRLYTFMMQGDDPCFDKNIDYHNRFNQRLYEYAEAGTSN